MSLSRDISMIVSNQGYSHECFLTRDIPKMQRDMQMPKSITQESVYQEKKPEKFNIIIEWHAELEKKALNKSISAKRITDESIDRCLMVWKYCLIGQNILRL